MLPTTGGSQELGDVRGGVTLFAHHSLVPEFQGDLRELLLEVGVLRVEPRVERQNSHQGGLQLLLTEHVLQLLLTEPELLRLLTEPELLRLLTEPESGCVEAHARVVHPPEPSEHPERAESPETSQRAESRLRRVSRGEEGSRARPRPAADSRRRGGTRGHDRGLISGVPGGARGEAGAVGIFTAPRVGESLGVERYTVCVDTLLQLIAGLPAEPEPTGVAHHRPVRAEA